ncbi:hypothetical protein EW026_g5803 [Hermanssonia centrifuga]|uniref:Uncharacterized protein n=1 Tax=Hermanssonia centrifuga TaxID=98765 RepID=A0A4V3X9Y2_9APHY|nr:hypothetical protein EW026_g5803 [Hermanssonia centrifuga]
MQKDFTDKEYAEHYRKHLKVLKAWEKLTVELQTMLMRKLQTDILKAARIAVGINDDETAALAEALPALDDLASAE